MEQRTINKLLGRAGAGGSLIVNVGGERAIVILAMRGGTYRAYRESRR